MQMTMFWEEKDNVAELPFPAFINIVTSPTAAVIKALGQFSS